jgi:5-methylthioadenosine/S-adenosylhomocysteine deaminase
MVGPTMRVYTDRLLTPTADGLALGPGEVTIEGHAIVAVRSIDRTAWRAEGPADGEERVDVGDRMVTPALINAHSHLSLGCLRGVASVEDNAGNVVEDVYYPVESNLTAEDVRAFTRVAAYESLLSGVGCVWDHYYFAEEVAAACREVGLSAVICPTLQDVSGPGKDAWEAQLEATVRLDDPAWADDGIVVALGPHATDTVSDALWKRVIDIADARGLWWHAHVSQSFEEFERSLSQHGVSPVERLRRLGALDAGAGALVVHGLYISDLDTDALDPARHVLGYCPFSQLQFAFPLPLDSWRSRNIPIVVATDCAAGNDTWNVQAELRLVAGGAAFTTTASQEHARFRDAPSLEHAEAVNDHRKAAFNARVAWADPQRLLDTVWKTPGRMHAGLPLGEIAVGRRANLLVWDTDHPTFWPRRDLLRALTTADVTHAIWGMVVNGRWVGERGAFVSSLRDSEGFREASAEASQRLKSLLKRAGL